MAHIIMYLQVFWLPSPYVFGGSAGAQSDSKRIKAYNAILYDVIRNWVVDNRVGDGNHKAFVDLYHLSCPLRRLAADPVHMMMSWYRTIAGHLLQLVCSVDDGTANNTVASSIQ